MSAPGTESTKKGGPVSEVATVGDLLLRAHAMEVEAAERYDEFAGQMELHNNPEVEALFRKLAGIERKHADSLAADLAARGIQAVARAPLGDRGEEGLETAAAGALHYLMTPYHALEIALQNEQRALMFFRLLAEVAVSAELRDLAHEFAREEAEHVELLQQWLARTTKPRDDWAYDPDEPRMPD
jgi:rubrerythrin